MIFIRSHVIRIARTIASSDAVPTAVTPSRIAASVRGDSVVRRPSAIVVVGASGSTDPVRKLVVPRVLAGVLMAPVLTVISDFVGILGGWLVARYQLQVPTGLYFSSIWKALYMQDLWMGLIKPFVLGYVIVTIACHVGDATPWDCDDNLFNTSKRSHRCAVPKT